MLGFHDGDRQNEKITLLDEAGPVGRCVMDEHGEQLQVGTEPTSGCARVVGDVFKKGPA